MIDAGQKSMGNLWRGHHVNRQEMSTLSHMAIQMAIGSDEPCVLSRMDGHFSRNDVVFLLGTVDGG